MKKLMAVILVLCMGLSLCACESSEPYESGDEATSGTTFKMTTALAAEDAVEDAINEWMSTKFLSFECTEFQYTITETERKGSRFWSDEETGMMWYTAFGTVRFYNDYGDVLADGPFSVSFGHNGVDTVSYIGEETVVDIYDW